MTDTKSATARTDDVERHLAECYRLIQELAATRAELEAAEARIAELERRCAEQNAIISEVCGECATLKCQLAEAQTAALRNLGRHADALLDVDGYKAGEQAQKQRAESAERRLAEAQALLAEDDAGLRELLMNAQISMRERCAKVCEILAEMMESGAGELEPGGRLRQAARNIRALPIDAAIAKEKP
jgi:uncharacterized coiled-coil protein SlyX